MGELSAQARRRLERAARRGFEARDGHTINRGTGDLRGATASVLQSTVAGNMSVATGASVDTDMFGFGQLQRAMAYRVKYRLYQQNPKRKLNCETMAVHMMNRGLHDIYPNGPDVREL
jgi:hypothetical protein